MSIVFIDVSKQQFAALQFLTKIFFSTATFIYWAAEAAGFTDSSDATASTIAETAWKALKNTQRTT